MSSTTSKSTGEATPTPPVFSYAQAAKGRTPAAAGSSVTSNQATSGISTPVKGTSSMTNTPSGGSERGDQSVNGSIDTSGKADQSVETNSESKGTTSTKSSSRPGSPSFGASSTSTLPKEEKDDFTLVGHGVESNRERHAHGSHSTEKGNEGSDGRKSKKGKKQKNAEKEAAEKEKAQQEEAKLQELLVPAPLPAVNFWNKRKEEAAKTKPTPVLASGSQAATEPALGNDNLRSPDTKRRGKVNGVDDGEKAVGAAQNSTIKDSPNTIKTQKKTNEASQKTKEEQTPKRAGPRGGRVGDKEEKSPVSQLPPPVEDAMSWPTPETALEEEKRRAQEKLEKEERDESSSNKPRPKKEWQTMPYVPSVNFNTPLPPRGGRGRGGARSGGRTENAGRTSHANNGPPGDKGQNVSAAAVSNTAENDKRVSRGDAPRAASLPPNSNKRQASDPASTRDNRKASTANQGDKPRGASKVDSSNISDIRNTSYAEHEVNFDLNNAHNDLSRNFKSDQMQGISHDTHAHPRSGADRRNEPGPRGFEQSKDVSHNSREGRSDRGRGGYRGRGSHNFQNGQQHPANIYTNGHGPQQPNGYPVRQGSGPYSPPLQGAPFNNHYPAPPSRGGRGGSRSQSIPNSAPMYARFPTNGAPGAHMPPLQTANMYEYQQPLQSMSAMPFNSYMDHVSVLAMVKMQLEYYFSIDNLCKDVFLRKHMDSQGFVFLTFIASFKRIQALTQDFDLLYTACQESEIIDQIRGEDGVDRLRRKEGWEKWVLPMDERDESVRNAGPLYHHRHRAPQLGHIALSGHQSMSPPPFSPNGTEASFRPFGNGVPATPHMNGNGHAYHPETPLSAAVPDFAPGLMAVNGTNDPLEAENTFNDEEIANLTLVFAPPKAMDETKPKTPYHTAASRTFSNGSIDGRSIAEEIQDDTRQGRALTNGSRAPEASPESLRRSRSPRTALSPTGSNASNAPPVMWVKGQRQQAPVSEHNSRESYTAFRARALKRRDASAAGETHADMKLLYEFWSHFLCRNFNLTMYSEFRQYAYEDAKSKAMSGMKNLISYYDEILNSKKKVIPEALARHYVDLVKEEDAEDRPAFERLRAAWRNGALDMKSRKKIDNLVDQKLREELEQAPKQKSDLS